MQDLIEDYLQDVKQSKAANTHANRKSDLRRYDEYLAEQDLNVAEANIKNVHRFLRDQGEKYAEETVNNRYNSVKGLYDFLVAWEEIDEDDHPIEESPYGRADYGGNGNAKKHQTDDIIYVTADEKELLREHVPSPQIRNELIVEMLFQTGVRRGELTRIEVEDLDRKNRRIEVWSPKTKEKRVVRYRPSLDFLLTQWLDHGYRDSYKPADESPYLLVSQRSERVDSNYVNEIVKEAAEEAGIQDELYVDNAGRKRYRVTAHALRHGHAVHALLLDIDTRFIQKQMGHSVMATMEQYLQITDKDVDTAYRRFHSDPLDEDEEPTPA